MFDTELDPLSSDQELDDLTKQTLADWDDNQPLKAQPIPRDLDEWSPGPFLAVVLSAIDIDDLDDVDLVSVLKAQGRQIAWGQAGMYSTMGRVACYHPSGNDDSSSEEWFEFASMEIAAALTLTRRAADVELDLAYQLLIRHPRIWKMLLEGTIDVRRAKTMVSAIEHLTTKAARDVVAKIIDRAAHLTTGQLRTRLARLSIEADPESASRQLEQGLDTRRVFSEINADGTANLLGLNLAPQEVAAVQQHINHLAHQLHRNDDPRTVDQIRADIYLDLLRGRDHQGTVRRGVVDIQVELKTLVGLSEKPGELPGFGPLLADLTRQLVDEQAESEWRVTVIDSTNSEVVHTGITRRRPTAHHKRRIQAIYPTCVFPGCRMPSRNCDIDHRTRYADGGPTTIENTEPLCRYHHRGKHTGWKLERNTDGSHLWTSPLGMTYTTVGRGPP